MMPIMTTENSIIHNGFADIWNLTIRFINGYNGVRNDSYFHDLSFAQNCILQKYAKTEIYDLMRMWTINIYEEICRRQEIERHAYQGNDNNIPVLTIDTGKYSEISRFFSDMWHQVIVGFSMGYKTIEEMPTYWDNFVKTITSFEVKFPNIVRLMSPLLLSYLDFLKNQFEKQ